MDQAPTAAALLNKAGSGRILLSDRDILADCPQCAAERPLSDATIEMAAETRRYRCSGCTETLVIVRRPNSNGISVAASGYRMGDWVLATAVDVRAGPLRFGGLENATVVDAHIKKAGGGQ